MTDPHQPDETTGRGRKPMLLFAGLAAALVAALVIAPYADGVLQRLSSQVAMDAAIGGPFTLVDHRGKPFTETDLTGRPALLFFGFTHCPDVCPTTLQAMSGWLADLGQDGDAVRAIFVTVDPGRDTPAAIAAYLGAFDQRIIGLTGTPEQVAAMLKVYRVYSKKVDMGGGDYAVDHSSAVYLMDVSGKFWSVIAMNEPRAGAVAKLKKLIHGG